MSSHQSENRKEAKEHKKEQVIPRKFIFNVQNIEDDEEVEDKRLANYKNFPLLKHLPPIHDFKKPEDIAESYSQVCQHLLNAYKEVRSLILEECVEGVKEVIENLHIGNPGECVQFLKSVLVKTYEKARETNQKQNIAKTIQEYEKLLQKSEVKIRDLIRNEQIYRISFDQFIAKDEEGEKNLEQLNLKLKENCETLEAMTKETARLKSLIKQKEEEIQCLSGPKGVQTEAADKKKCHTDSGHSKIEYHKPKSQSFASQHLKSFLKNNKSPLAENSKNITTNLDLSKLFNSSKRATTKTPQASTARVLQSSGTTGDLAYSSNKAYKFNRSDRKKDPKDYETNYEEIFSERKRLNASGDQAASHSARASHWLNNTKKTYTNHKKNKSGQNKVKSRSPTTKSPTSKSPTTKSKAKRESSEGDGTNNSPGKFRPYEDLSAFLLRTESAENKKRNLSSERGNKSKENESEYQLKASTSHTQNVNSKKKSNVLKAGSDRNEPGYYSHEKSAEQRTHTAKVESATSNMIASRNHIPLSEQKDNVKNASKPNVPLINIMLKKLSEQKNLMKKVPQQHAEKLTQGK